MHSVSVHGPGIATMSDTVTHTGTINIHNMTTCNQYMYSMASVDVFTVMWSVWMSG